MPLWRALSISSAGKSARTLVVALSAALMAPPQAFSQSDEIVISPFVNRECFELFCDDLQLSEPQFRAADAAYETYVSAMRGLSQAFVARIREVHARAGWSPRQPASDEPAPATRGGDEPRAMLPQQVLEIADFGHRARMQTVRDARRLQSEFEGAITQFLSASQVEDLPFASAALRRNTLLLATTHPNVMLSDLTDQVPNLRALITGASHIFGEGAQCTREGFASDSASAALRARINGALEQFDRDFSSAIEGDEETRIEAGRELARAYAAGDLEARLDVQRTEYQHWRRKFDAVDRATRQIAGALTEIDVTAGNAWLDCVNAVWYPTIFQRESSDALYDWFIQQESLVAMRSQADEARARYASARKSLRNFAMQLAMERRKSSFEWPLKPELRTKWENENTNISQRRRELCDRTNAALRSLLPNEDIQRAFDRELKRFREAPYPTLRQLPP